MLTQSSRDRNILKNLAWFATYVHLSNGQGKMDINHDAEDFYCGLLNILFTNNSNHGFADKEVQLHNMNSIQMDYPAIDLGDEQNRLCVQITASEHRDKVRTTLKKFFSHNLDATYDRLIVLMIGTKDEFTKKFDVERNFDFEANRDVWDTNRLGAEIGKLSDERRQMLATYIDGRVETQKEKTVHLHLPLVSALQPSAFVGREDELASIREKFEDGDKLVVLTGLGGMGKTELAVKFGRDYAGTVYFARFDTSFTKTLANMAMGIKPALSDEELGQPEEVLCAMVFELLGKADKNDLLIIDNADTDSLADLCQALMRLPLKVLLTTRSDWDEAISVERIEDEHLREILTRYGAKLTVDEMDAIIRTVNGHTLTIDLIARTLNGKGLKKVTAKMMIESLKKNTLPSEKYRKIATHYNQSTEQAQIYQHLSTVFNVSDISDGDKYLLRHATLFPENGISGDLMAGMMSEDGITQLESLIERGWLEMKDGLLTIHPVIRLVCRTELEPTDDNCGDFLNALDAQWSPQEYDRVKYAQLAEVFALAAEILEDTNAEWINASGCLRLNLAQYDAAKNLYEKHLPGLEKRLKDTKLLATVYNNLGSIYGKMGDHSKALEFQMKDLAICEKVLPPEHPDLAQSYNNVSCTYSELGETEKDLEYGLKALKIREKVLPPEHPSLATSYNNVGITYAELEDFSKAVEYLEKALAIVEKVLPSTHPYIASTKRNLACVRSRMK